MPHRRSCGTTGVHSRRSALVLLMILSACSHQDPFPSGDPVDNGPRSTTPPVQLTFSPGMDWSPSWNSDGTRIAYSYNSEEGVPGDRCLAGLPGAGGTRNPVKCFVALDRDTVRALGPVALGPGTLAAWVDAQSLVGHKVPDWESIRVGTMGIHDTGVAVRTFPFPAPSGTLQLTATSLTWLSATVLGYVANDRFLLGPCNGCKVDTLLVAREAVLLDLGTSPAGVTVLPNTSEVTSIFAAADGLSLYFTRAGDSRVFQRVLASGNESVVHTFSGIVRDVNVRGNTLTAVVGGKVQYGLDPIIGNRQIDSGGVLTRLDLQGGTETPFPLGDAVVRHPTLSSDGASVVVEVYDSLAAVWQSDLYRVPLQ